MAISRQHPFISPIGCGSALVVMMGVAIVTLLSGGEQFNPGDLSAIAKPAGTSVTVGTATSHAEFEMDCRECHVPFRGINAARCEECHTTVGDERATRSGLHGSDHVGDTTRCQDCHREHQGRTADLLADARKQFNHSTLVFSLARHVRDYAQKPLVTQCATCHTGASFATEMSSCTLCHGAHDQVFMLDHTAAFGSGCLACHDGTDTMTGFDHGQTDFPLKALHATVACAECHTAEVAPPDAPTECAACHAESIASHAGMFGADCAACHTPAGWSPATLDTATFDHKSTGFELTSHATDYDGTPFTCRTCHTGMVNFTEQGAFTFDQQRCVECHTQADAAFMTQHTQEFGLDCLSCHDGSGNMKNFDHANFFVLDGQHATLTCEQCHVQKKFKGTSKECVSCHAEPQVHLGIFGADCAACHTTSAWTPARLTQHAFPLDHGEQGEVACATCHPSTYPAYTCYGCHEHVEAEIVREHAEENIRGEKLNDCMACHANGQKENEGGDG